ncbi:MAG: hypothetical protein ACLPWD_07140 [Methanobacterium sp.]
MLKTYSFLLFLLFNFSINAESATLTPDQFFTVYNQSVSLTEIDGSQEIEGYYYLRYQSDLIDSFNQFVTGLSVIGSYCPNKNAFYLRGKPDLVVTIMIIFCLFDIEKPSALITFKLEHPENRWLNMFFKEILESIFIINAYENKFVLYNHKNGTKMLLKNDSQVFIIGTEQNILKLNKEIIKLDCAHNLVAA